jgi:hypothetical protein
MAEVKIVKKKGIVLVMEIGWTDVGSGGYIFVSTAHSNTTYIIVTEA